MKPKRYAVRCCSCSSIHIVEFGEDDSVNWIQFCNCSVLPLYQIGKKPKMVECEKPDVNNMIFFDEKSTFIKNRG